MKPTRGITLITGASRGLGLATARICAARGTHLLLACRSLAQAERAHAEIVRSTGCDPAAIQSAQLDVSDLDSVRAFAARYAGERLEALVCNAGLQRVHGVERTRQGIEETFASNHLGHYLLARLLYPSLIAQRGSIVFVASNTHDPARCTGMPAPRADDLAGLADGSAFDAEPLTRAGQRRYTTSKLCNVLCTYELARRFAHVSTTRDLGVFAFDPGLMPGTGLARDYGPLARWAFRVLLPLMTFAPNVNSVLLSARRLADLADGTLQVAPGSYVSRGRPCRSSALSYDPELARKLWELSAALCEVSPSLSGESP